MAHLRRRLVAWFAIYGVNLHVVRRNLAGRRQYRSNRRRFDQLREGCPHTADFPMGSPWPCLGDRFDAGGVAAGQYFHQDLIVAQWIFEASPQRHVDVGSRVDGFVAHVAAFRSIEVLDIRPVSTSARSIIFRQRDIMQEDRDWDECCDSLSCLHTIEHFGLGRYGDALDPDGWVVGWRNLVRMVRPGGSVYLSTMIGRQRIEFDAHRVFAVSTVMSLVADTCDVESIAYVDDLGDIHPNVSPSAHDVQSSFGCENGCLILRLRRR